MRRLIVNADDYGLTPGINRAVAELHAANALSSATLMATAPDGPFAEAVSQAAQMSSLGVGCHVVLVDGIPALPVREIPSLVGGTEFRPKLGAFVADLLCGRISETDIEKEAVAQIRKLQLAGISVTHVDTHKHTHMFPRVLRPLVRAALECGVKAIRNPFEPDWALQATSRAGRVRKMQVRLLRSQSASFAREIRKSGLMTTDGAIGVLATGSLDEPTAEHLLAALPEGTWELVCHPGYNDADLQRQRTRLRESRDIERRALLKAVPGAQIKVIHFGQL
ncbi:MAG: ChbG/HpnK family deacetylase [Bacillota bacterium]|nr:ChbG/HpnK family deacetylase [Bacillota bacterium]